MKKTTKSFAKRLKVTKNGKVLARKPGQNHFNAKERSRRSSDKRRMKSLNPSNDMRSRFLVNLT